MRHARKENSDRSSMRLVAVFDGCNGFHAGFNRVGVRHSLGMDLLLTVLPDIPHQLCHFHYLKEAAKPEYEADKHAKKELKKYLRGVRPIERAVEKRRDVEAEAIRGYCLAVRSALTDDGRPPLSAPGLKLYKRITAIAALLNRVSEKGVCRVS
jgi:hypothetical protein